MKAVLSNRIYLDGTEEFFQHLENELTYTLPPRMPQDPPIVIKTIRHIRKGLCSIPMGREDLITTNYEIVD